MTKIIVENDDTHSDASCFLRMVTSVDDDKCSSSSDEINQIKKIGNAEDHLEKYQLCFPTTDECTDSCVSTTFNSPVKGFTVKKISQECLPAFSISKQLAWNEDSDNFWQDEELTTLLSPTLNMYISTQS